MTSSEELCLQWNDFENIVRSAFADLRNDEDLTDVTLAFADGRQIKAHKLVLAAMSPFFLDLLKRNKHPHPLIYMKGIKSENMLAMINFLHKGEADVLQDNLESFLALADEMRLKGLSPEKSQEQLDSTQTNQTTKETIESELALGPNIQTENLPLQNSKRVSKIALNTSEEVTKMQDLADQIHSMMKRGENRYPHKIGQGKVREEFTRICKVCGKEGRFKDIQDHIEANHISGVTHTCDICGKEAKTRNSLKAHKWKYHPKEL